MATLQGLFIRLTLALALVAGTAGIARADGAPLAAAVAIAPPAEDPATAESLAHFRQGNALFKEGAWGAALAELLESRRLHPTMNATRNAAVCLRELLRFDEALDLYEALLKDFAAPPADLKAEAQQAIVDLRHLVGTITVEGAAPGAAIVLDGRARGEHPLLAPLRVASGSHVVRVYKEGFLPFEAGIEVAGGQTAEVEARLRPLLRAGRLRVTEREGRRLDVVVDGYHVGETPWEGPIAVGGHTVLLRGGESLGTLPAPVSVELDGLTALALAAETLDASVRVVPSPATASVALDGIFVGRGAWEGRLRPGAHTLRVVADGYFSEDRPLQLERGARAGVAVTLRKDPRSPVWRRPGRFSLELEGAFAGGAGFGGDVGSGCNAPCSRGPALGGHVAFRGGYEMWNGFGFGVTAGYLDMEQATRGRSSALQPVGLTSPDLGTVDDRVKLRGFLAGGWVGYVTGERFPLRLRLGAGALVSAASDTRTGSFHPADTTLTQPFTVGPVIVSRSVTWFTLDPAVRLGIRVGPHVELSAGVTALVLFSLSAPRWDAARPINAATDGWATFPGETLTSPVLFAVMPGLGARYDF